jgi:two-component system, cell cycle sensor histidine kinase and response regulator CckA
MQPSRVSVMSALLNQFMVGSHSVVVCQYQQPQFDPAVIHDVLLTHPIVFLGDLVCPNPYYEPPELVLRQSPMATAEFKKSRVVWWVTRLRMARETELRWHEAEEALLDREEYIRLLLDSTAEAIYGIDLDGNCNLANSACARLLGYASPDDLVGKNMHALMHHTGADGSPYPESACPIYQTYRAGDGTHVDDEVFWRADGSRFDVEYFTYPMRRGGKIVGAVVTFLDVTDRKRLEHQLRQAQKMEAVGQLAGGIAHDFNNLLTMITVYSDLLLNEIGAGTDAREFVEEIRKAGERAVLLTRQLLAFSRSQVLAPKVLDLNDIIRDTETMLRRVIGEDVTLTTDLQRNLCRVKADPGQVQQVLMNLSVNARDAMPTGGTLLIETRNVDIPDPKSPADPASGTYAVLIVRDSGTGMSEDVQRRIFEPFFTTKEAGRGTGLGLAVVHGFVQQSGGHVEVDSTPGVGAAFSVFLPAVDGALHHEEAAETLLAKGSETILLVEDEDGVRALTRHVLASCGYVVLEASNGNQALRICGDHRGPIALLVTDVVMPGMGGRVLAEKVVVMRPETRVLYVSGYTDDAVVRHGVLLDEVHLLQKPFTPAALARKVREVLAESS